MAESCPSHHILPEYRDNYPYLYGRLIQMVQTFLETPDKANRARLRQVAEEGEAALAEVRAEREAAETEHREAPQ